MYLDHFASAHAISASARERMGALLALPLGNPSSMHGEGRLARKVLREARAEVAAALSADPDEVIFVSGVTEALALAVHGLVLPQRPPRVACSIYEHVALRSALVATGRELQTFEYDLAGRPVAGLQAVPGLVAAAVVNHETGLIASLSGLCTLAQGAPLVIDAAQAAAMAKACWAMPAVTALCLSSHKIGGPSGAGALILRKGHPFVPLVRGGPQEHELRAGTEAVVAAAGFARALSDYVSAAPQRSIRLAEITKRFEVGLASLAGVRIVAQDRVRAPGVTAAYALGVPARALCDDLDARGIQIASGAACAAHSSEPSNVLAALGLSRERSLEVFRVSFSGEETDAAVGDVLAIMKEVIGKRRGEMADAGA